MVMYNWKLLVQSKDINMLNKPGR